MTYALYQVICLVLLFSVKTSAEEASKDSLPFGVGERLDFKVYLGFILGGDASMSINSIEEIDGYPCYKIVSEARSTKTVDIFYKVRDRIVSWRDVEGGFTRQYDKHLREGKYKADRRVEYKPEDGIAYYYRNNSKTADTIKIDGLVYDVLSAFYQMRVYDLEVGNSIWLDVHDIDKQYRLEIAVLRKEKIKVPAGEFDCFVVEPKLMSSGIFRREGKMQIWLSDDEYKLPIIMRSKLYFGSVWAKLVSYRLSDNE